MVSRRRIRRALPSLTMTIAGLNEALECFKALAGAFPDEPGFVVEQHLAGASIEQAKIAHAEKVEAENTNLKAENEKLKAEEKASKTGGK